jgi:hypothetical protein
LDQNSLADLEKVLETKTKKDKQYMGKKTWLKIIKFFEFSEQAMWILTQLPNYENFLIKMC